MTKIKAAKKIPGKWAEGPTVAESYKDDIGILTGISWRMKMEPIDSPAYVRGPKPIPPQDPFLAYLEWKMDRPWYKRLFLP